jgi:hypothetical protein
MASPNPTFASVQNNEMAYSTLPQDVRQMVETNPWRQKHNIEPRAMMQMAYGSMQNGEDLAGAIKRLIPGLPKVAGILSALGRLSPELEEFLGKEASMARARGVRRIGQLLTGSRAAALEGAVKGRAPVEVRRMNDWDKSQLTEVRTDRAKQFIEEARGRDRLSGAAEKEHAAVQSARRIAKGVGIGVGAAALGGAALASREKKANFSTSQYSGELGPGPGLPYASGMPSFRVEPFKKPKEKTAEDKLAFSTKAIAMVDELEKICGVPTSPAARLSVSRGVGAPKVSAPSGPSIADISKPVGFGMKMPGAMKTL